MKKTLLLPILFIIVHSAKSQTPTPTSIMTELIALNNQVKNDNCAGKKGTIVTNKALNNFFANKIASYLSETGDLSLYKNYATLNSSDGLLSISSNVFSNTGQDGRIKSLTTIGVKANIADGFASIFQDKKFSNEIGITLMHTWMGRGTTFFDGCSQKQAKGLLQPPPIPSGQKLKMDAERAYILHTLETEINNKAAEFESGLNNMRSAELPNQSLATVRNNLRNKFYNELREEYLNKFAEMQATSLEETESYNAIKTKWTSLQAYIPVTTQKYTVAPSYEENFSDKEIYPWEVTLSHNAIKEIKKIGRIFLDITGKVVGNNNIKTDELGKISLNDYKNLGGTDTVHFAELEANDAYTGSYRNFVTPILKGQVVWFPKKWNVGVSVSLEQNFGEYNPLNGKLGFPIRLNDKDGDATVNFEIQIRTTDITNKIDSQSFGKKTAVGVSVGLPFTSIIY